MIAIGIVNAENIELDMKVPLVVEHGKTMWNRENKSLQIVAWPSNLQTHSL